MEQTISNLNTTPLKSRNKPFYRNAHWYFAFCLVIIITGFYSSFFSKIKQTDLSHQAHGIAAMLWIVLLIVEPFLVSRKQLKWHRRLGKLSFVIVPVFTLTALKMIQTMILGKANYPPLVVYQLSFLDFFMVFQFILFYSLAIIKRRQIQLHARYMAATVFIFLLPALTRALFLFPFIDNFRVDLNVGYVMAEVAMIILIIDDKRSGKIRLPYVLAFGSLIIQHVFLNFIADLSWWRSLMDSYAAI